MKPGFMLASLIWWATNACLLVACVYSYVLSLHGEIHQPTKNETYFSVAIGSFRWENVSEVDIEIDLWHIFSLLGLHILCRHHMLLISARGSSKRSSWCVNNEPTRQWIVMMLTLTDAGYRTAHGTQSERNPNQIHSIMEYAKIIDGL